MQTVFLDFQTRVQEVDQYFQFLDELIRENTKLTVLEDDGSQRVKLINSDMKKILKANAFLVLYNLVESTMRNAIEAIFDEISSRRISYNLIRTEIKKIVIHNFKNLSSDNVHSNIRDISIDIITAGFNRKKLFSGNVDRDEITKTARKYGFSFSTDYSKTKHGEHLYDIMQHRNDLSHGNKSFTDIGQMTSIEDLLKIKEEVVEYLHQILLNIKDYLDNQEYLADTAQTN